MLDLARDEMQRRGETFRYSGRCRDRGLAAGALRLRIPEHGTTVVDDLIHGAVSFDHQQLDDWILVRTDGTPTYNFCVVVDDVTMAISHVIRGNDHLSNTPKQMLCYEALGYAVPAFAHVPMILGSDKSRLSKRHGATSIQAFRDAGIPAEAMVNYLARLGWSHGDQEIFTARGIGRPLRHQGRRGLGRRVRRDQARVVVPALPEAAARLRSSRSAFNRFWPREASRSLPTTGWPGSRKR